MIITEPDVTFTDYGLAIECAFFTCLLYRRGNSQPSLRIWFALFFGSLSVAALTGGTVHGFFLDTNTLGYAIFWPATLLSIGVTAMAAWAIGAQIQFSPMIGRWIRVIAIVEFISYCFIVLFVTQVFVIAAINYLPATLFLLIVFSITYRRLCERKLLIGLMGLVLTFVAALVQWGKIALHPVYFNHNALYHLIQAVALFMVFWSAQWWVKKQPT